MKIFLLILLSICSILKAEYPRYNIRTPPAQYHYRVPQNKQFAKKWHQPHRGGPAPIRSRPLTQIPVHMPLSHKIPMGFPSVSPRPVSPPVRSFWKNTQNQMKFPVIEKPHQIPQQVMKKKPFSSTPSLTLPEYDYHIQTNNIPNGPVNTIKQVGEKGPIHTIPAPNLSLKDKPNVVNEVRKEVNYPQTTAYIQVDQSHHYQVTEPPESGQAKLFRAQQDKLQQLQQQQQFQQHQLQQQQLYQQQQHFQMLQQQKQQEKIHQIQQQKLQQYQQQLLQQQFKQQSPADQFQQQQSPTSEVQVQPQQIYLTEQTAEIQPGSLQQSQVQGDIISSNQLSQQDLYQLLGASYPQHVVPAGLVQSVKIEPDSDFQADNLFVTNQEFDLNAESTVNSHPGTLDFKPEFQSFNYDEQAHQASQKDLMKKKLSSLVTATYTLSPGNVFERHGQVESEEAPYKQFGNRSDMKNSGESEETTEKRENNVEKTDEKVLETPYYSSLPSKEAADRLADLQAAEKDDNTAGNENDTSHIYHDNTKEANIEYDDYAQEDNQSLESIEQNSKEFGSRIRPKTKN